MMKKAFFRLFSLGLIISAAACSGNNTGSNSNKKSGAAVDSIDSGKSTTADVRKDSVINLIFPAGDSTAAVTGELGGAGEHITVHVPVHDQSKLTALLTPLDSMSNIRFNQIIYPDGKKDGPFGRKVSIAAPQNGDYQLIIGHNLMAEGALAGAFKLQVSLSR